MSNAPSAAPDTARTAAPDADSETNGPPPPETRYVDTATVACDGGELGHPRVFLQIGKAGYVECPYCDCRFVLNTGAGPGEGT